MRSLQVVGVSHHSAPVDVRERLACPGDRIPELLRAVRACPGVSEVVLISTCNRVELYFAWQGDPEGVHDPLHTFLGFQGVTLDEVREHLYRRHDEEALRHLFKVAASLDSLVVGETQILGQVRNALQLAHGEGTVGGPLEQAFQRAMKAARHVQNETAITSGALSIASVAVDLARKIFSNLEELEVCCIGAGEMGELVLEHMAAAGVKGVCVLNRTLATAERIAQERGGRAAPLEHLDDELARADIAITSTAAREPFLTKERAKQILKKRGNRTLFLIDIAVPRDVDSTVGKLDNVYLYNVDDLQQVVEENLERRQAQVSQSLEIVEQQLQRYSSQVRRTNLDPTIAELTGSLGELVESEFSRVRSRLSRIGLEGEAFERVEKELHEAMRHMANTIAFRPIRTMKDEAHKGDGSLAARWVRRLFHLRDEESREEEGWHGEP